MDTLSRRRTKDGDGRRGSGRTPARAFATALLALAALTSGACGQRRNIATAAERPVRIEEHVAPKWPRPYPTWSPERRAARALPPCTFPIRMGPVGGQRLLEGASRLTHPPCGGTVVMEAVVKPDGSIGRVSVVQSLGDTCDALAVATVRTWRYSRGYWAGGPEDKAGMGCSFLPGDPLTVLRTVTVVFR